MNKKRVIVLCLVVGLVCALLVVWFQHQSSTDVPAVRDDVYELRILCPMTGSLSEIGEQISWTVGYVQDRINRNGGIGGIPVELRVVDTQFDANHALKLARETAETDRILIGPVDSPGTTAVAAWVREERIPNIAAYSYEEIRESAAPFGISYMSDSVEGDLSAVNKWHDLNPDIENVVILINDGDSSQEVTAERIKGAGQSLGIRVTDIVRIAGGEHGVLSAVLAAINAKPDGFVILARFTDYPAILRELRLRGVKEGRRITASFSSYDGSLAAQDPEILEGTYVWNKHDVHYYGAAWQALLAAYRADHNGLEPDSHTVSDIYDAIMAWKQAIEELGISPVPADLAAERARLAEWFYRSPEIDGIQGSFRWIDGSKDSRIFYFQFGKDGEKVRIE